MKHLDRYHHLAAMPRPPTPERTLTLARRVLHLESWRRPQKRLANIPAAPAPRPRTANTAALFVRARPATRPLSANAGTPPALRPRLQAAPEPLSYFFGGAKT